MVSEAARSPDRTAPSMLGSTGRWSSGARPLRCWRNHTLQAAQAEGWSELWATFVDVDVRLTIDFNASPPLEDQTAAGEARTELPADARLLYDHLSPGCEQRQYDSRTLGHLLGPAAAVVVIELQPKDTGSRYNPRAVYFATFNPSGAGDRSIPC